MSQAGLLDVITYPLEDLIIIADSGSAMPIANTLEFLGDISQGISSSASGNTVTYTIADATTVQKGVIETSTDAESIAGVSTEVAVVPSSLAAKLGTQTANAVPYGGGSSASFSWMTPLTDGQLVIGASGGAPAGANLTSMAGTIAITVGPNTINLDLAGGGIGVDSFTVPSGTSPVVPDAAGNIDLPAGNGFSFMGGTNSMTGNMNSPFTGDFTFTDSTAGNTETLTISNTDNTAANASSANVAVSVAGTTQTGDPYVQWNVGSAVSYSIGPDVTDSQIWKFTVDAAAGVTPSTGNTIFFVDSGRNLASYNTKILDVTNSFSASFVQVSAQNSDTTSTDSSVRLTLTTQDGTGDCYVIFDPNFGAADQSFELGQDATDDSFNINFTTDTSASNLSGSNFFKISSSGVITFDSAYAFPTTDGTANQILVTDGAGALTFQDQGSGYTWSDESGAFNAVVNHGYFITATATATLPASPSNGQAISFIVDTTDILTIQANTGQTIRLGNTVSSSAGTCLSTDQGDAIALVYRATNTSWIADSGSQGNWTLA